MKDRPSRNDQRTGSWVCASVYARRFKLNPPGLKHFTDRNQLVAAPDQFRDNCFAGLSRRVSGIMQQYDRAISSGTQIGAGNLAGSFIIPVPLVD
jgi:hypothetical protein